MSREGIVLEHAGMNTAKIIRMSWKIKPSLEVGTGINPREIFLIITEVSGKNWRRRLCWYFLTAYIRCTKFVLLSIVVAFLPKKKASIVERQKKIF